VTTLDMGQWYTVEVDDWLTYLLCTGLLDHVTVLIGVAVNGEAVAGVIHQPYFNYQSKEPGIELGRTIWGIVGLGWWSGCTQFSHCLSLIGSWKGTWQQEGHVACEKLVIQLSPKLLFWEIIMWSNLCRQNESLLLFCYFRFCLNGLLALVLPWRSLSEKLWDRLGFRASDSMFYLLTLCAIQIFVILLWYWAHPAVIIDQPTYTTKNCTASVFLHRHTHSLEPPTIVHQKLQIHH